MNEKALKPGYHEKMKARYHVVRQHVPGINRGLAKMQELGLNPQVHVEIIDGAPQIRVTWHDHEEMES